MVVITVTSFEMSLGYPAEAFCAGVEILSDPRKVRVAVECFIQLARLAKDQTASKPPIVALSHLLMAYRNQVMRDDTRSPHPFSHRNVKDEDVRFIERCITRVSDRKEDPRRLADWIVAQASLAMPGGLHVVT